MAEELVPAVAGLFLVGWIFVPGFRSLIIAALAICIIAILGWLGFRIFRSKKTETSPFTYPDVEKRREGYDHVYKTSSNTATINERAGKLNEPSRVDAGQKREPTLSENLRSIDWFQFEKLIAAIYTAKGFTVKRLGGANPDGGVDLIVENSKEKFISQCKHWRTWKVGVRQIREFLGTLTDTKVPKGVFITLQGYTDDARTLAAKHGIVIVSETGVLQMLHEIDWNNNRVIVDTLNDVRKFCPRCESEMVLRTARRGTNVGGKFWGCSRYPTCRFVLNADEAKHDLSD